MSSALGAECSRRISEALARWTGFHPDAIWGRAVERALAPWCQAGATPEELADRAARGEVALLRQLSQAIAVGESFFFRHPDHFHHVEQVLVPQWNAAPERPVRVWTAGCAAGEETYSLASTLHAAGVRDFSILGTDLCEKNVAWARQGRYPPWSVRPSAPLLHDPFVPGPGPLRDVLPELKARARFVTRNLLEPLGEPGGFDLIFCRNVLIYFSPEASAQVCASLRDALAPGGTVCFAAVDLTGTPAGLERVGPPELQVFRRADRVAASRVAAAPSPAPWPESFAAPAASPPLAPSAAGSLAPLGNPAGGASPPVRPPRPEAPAREGLREEASEPVALHLRALAHIERGEHRQAGQLLDELQRSAPSYVPGLLETALFLARDGRRRSAVGLMRAVLERTLVLPAERPIAGPECLPARYYAAAAQAFLDAESNG